LLNWRSSFGKCNDHGSGFTRRFLRSGIVVRSNGAVGYSMSELVQVIVCNQTLPAQLQRISMCEETAAPTVGQ